MAVRATVVYLQADSKIPAWMLELEVFEMPCANGTLPMITRSPQYYWLCSPRAAVRLSVSRLLSVRRRSVLCNPSCNLCNDVT